MDDTPLHDALGRLNNRITKHQQDAAEQLDAGLNRIEKHIDNLAARLAFKLDQVDADTQREINEMRRDLGDVRDQLHIVERQAANAVKAAESADGRAQEAVKAAQSADERAQQAADKAQQGLNATRTSTAATMGAVRNAAEISVASSKVSAATFWKQPTGLIVKWGTALAAMGGAIGALPIVIKFIRETLALWGKT